MQNKFFIKVIFSTLWISVILNPLLVYSAEKNDTTIAGSKNFDVGLNYQGVDGSIKDYLCTPSESADGKDLERCVGRLFRFGITAGGLVSVFFVVMAGYLYLFSGESGKTKAKLYLKNSLTGMAVLLSSYLLLNFINPSLVMFKPIQPPIFDAADLPSCEDIGFSTKCTLPSEESGGKPASSGGGTGKVLSSTELTSLQNQFESDFKSTGVIFKKDWGGVVPTKELNQNTSIKYVVVHHTASSADSPKSIENFHINSNGWSDVGYHFIITKDGKIYQGRYGGPGVVGAHFHGFNSGNIGIAVVGNFNNEEVSSAAKASLEKLVSTIKNKYGLKYSGQTQVEGANINVTNLAYHGQINGVTGKDGKKFSTECPGKNLIPVVKGIAQKLGLEVPLDSEQDILVMN